jgi:IclR family pca regulon transcriptional regulator
MAAITDPPALRPEAISRPGDRDFVTGLARGLAVLLALSDKRRGMSIAQISNRVGIPRAAVRRSLHTLTELGFVAPDDDGAFYLRPRVLSFSHAFLSSSPLAVLAQAVLDNIGERMREAFSLATLDGDEIVYLARSATSRIMSPSLNVGRRLPAYCTSIGFVMLAHLRAAELDDYFGRVKLAPYSRFTPRTSEEVRAILEHVRASGYAYASQMMEARLSTLAVPVRDTSGRVVAGINVILHGRLVEEAEMADRFLEPLRLAALELGSLLVG